MWILILNFSIIIAQEYIDAAISNIITNKGLCLVLDEIKSPTLSNTPVLTKAPDRTNIQIIVHGAGFERIYKNSLLGRTPNITIKTAVLKAVTSIGINSVTKKIIIVIKRSIEIIISKFSKINMFLCLIPSHFDLINPYV